MVNNGTIDSMLAQDLIHIAIDPEQRFHNLVQIANIGLTTRSRNVMVKTFLETTQAAWLLMIDSDERISLETFKKLVNAAHDKDRPIVSGLVFAAFFDNDDALRPVPTIYKMDMETGLGVQTKVIAAGGEELRAGVGVLSTPVWGRKLLDDSEQVLISSVQHLQHESRRCKSVLSLPPV